MLILSRTKHESIVIRVPPSSEVQEIKVMVTELRGNKARLGFTANREVSVFREEVQAKIDSEATN